MTGPVHPCPTRTQAWRELASEVGDFHRQHGRWPGQTATADAEKKLGVWLARQRMAARGKSGAGSFTPERRQHLDEVAPGWDVTMSEHWDAIAAQVGAFHRAHGRWPSPVADAADEKRLGQWLGTQRQASSGETTHPMTPARREHLDTVAPGWDVSSEQRWQQMCRALGDFRDRCGRWPSSKAEDRTERRLGQWLGQQRAAGRAGHPRLTDDRRTRLDAVAPGWLGVDRKAAWLANAARLSAFVRGAGRFPSKASSDRQESSLGAWLAGQRHAARGGQGAGSFTPERGAHLDEVVPGWSGEH